MVGQLWYARSALGVVNVSNTQSVDAVTPHRVRGEAHVHVVQGPGRPQPFQFGQTIVVVIMAPEHGVCAPAVLAGRDGRWVVSSFTSRGRGGVGSITRSTVDGAKHRRRGRYG
jgi:hypothetical protein